MSSHGLGQEQSRGEAVRTPGRTVLEVLHDFLTNPPGDTSTLQVFLGKLAGAFGARGAGSALLVEGAAFRKVLDKPSAPGNCWPWETVPELARRGNAGKPVREFPGPQGNRWLVAAVPLAAEVRCLLWLEDRAAKSWDDREKAALALAVQTVASWLDTEKEPWSEGIENKRHQQRLEEAAVITGRLAHDFGNVLTAVCGFAELALMQLPAVSPAHVHVRELAQAARTGSLLIQKLSLFSRRRSRSAGAVSLHLILGEEAARVRRTWPAPIVLQVELDEDLPPVCVEGEAFRQVLGQLLDNAREAIPSQGLVTVRGRQVQVTEEEALRYLGTMGPGTYLEVAITDTGAGPGMERWLLRELFVTTKPGHRGLGLAVVYGILQAYQCGLRFDAAPEGGTAVRVLLPLAAATAPRDQERRLLEKIAAGADTQAAFTEAPRWRDSSAPPLSRRV